MNPAYVTIPAGTRISVRTMDAIDSTYNVVGDRFQASLEEPLMLEGNVLVAEDALVYGRLTQSKESGMFTGRSQLRLELTGIVVNGKLVPVVTGEYEVTGKSRGASTAKRTVAERLLERSSVALPTAAREQRSVRASAQVLVQARKSSLGATR